MVAPFPTTNRLPPSNTSHFASPFSLSFLGTFSLCYHRVAEMTGRPAAASSESAPSSKIVTQPIHRHRESPPNSSNSAMNCWRNGRLQLPVAPCLLILANLLLLISSPGIEARAFPSMVGGNEMAAGGNAVVSPIETAWQSSLAAGEPLGGIGDEDGTMRTMEKRRLVVRVPFAQNPDGHQLSRIYKSLFEPSNTRAKKQPWAYSLRHFVAGPDGQ